MGFFGIHRIYVKKIFSGILYIFFEIFAFLPYLSFFIFRDSYFYFILKKYFRLTLGFSFTIVFIVQFVYIKDLILIVTGMFKDKEGKFIKEEYFKKNRRQGEKISPLDLNVLLRLSLFRPLEKGKDIKPDWPGHFGLYLFYSGHFKKGMVYIIYNRIGYIFIALCCIFYINLTFYGFLIYCGCLYLPIYFLVLYDRYLIKKKRFKDKYGRIIAIKRTDRYY